MSEYWQGFCSGAAVVAIVMYLLLNKEDAP